MGKRGQVQYFKLCPLSTMKDLYDIVKESDKILSF